MITLDKDERVLFRIYKDWVALAIRSIVYILLGIAPLALYILFRTFSDISIEAQFTYLLSFFYSLWILIVWILFFIEFTDFALDSWIVTNERIIDIDQRSLFNREVSTLRLDTIQDITTETTGVLFTLLKIGEIHVQTAASEREFVIKDVAHPQIAKDALQKAYSAEVERAQRVVIVQNE